MDLFSCLSQMEREREIMSEKCSKIVLKILLSRGFNGFWAYPILDLRVSWQHEQSPVGR